MLANPSRSAGDLTARAVTPRSSRLAIPVRVPAGGNSTIAVTVFSVPARRYSVHRSQRTGWVSWATSVSIAAAAEVTGFPSRLDNSVAVGSAVAMAAAAAA